MADGSNDTSVLKHIEDLVAEEHRLMDRKSVDPEDHARLSQVQIKLDQYWDLLRQRRAKRETGKPPGDAHVRPAGTVENYEG